MNQIRPRLEGGDGGEIGRPRVHDATAEDADATTLTLVKVVAQFGHPLTHSLLEKVRGRGGGQGRGHVRALTAGSGRGRGHGADLEKGLQRKCLKVRDD